MRNRKAQYFSETALLFAVIIAVFIGMQIYVKRGLQARTKTVVDAGVSLAQNALPDLHMAGNGHELLRDNPKITQYEPYYSQEDANTVVSQANRKYKNKKNQKTENYYHSEAKTQSVAGFDFNRDELWEK